MAQLKCAKLRSQSAPPFRSFIRRGFASVSLCLLLPTRAGPQFGLIWLDFCWSLPLRRRRRECAEGNLSGLHVGEELPHFRFQVFRLDRDGIGEVLDVGGGGGNARRGI